MTRPLCCSEACSKRDQAIRRMVPGKEREKKENGSVIPKSKKQHGRNVRTMAEETGLGNGTG